jgi:hypothetical protein
VTGPDVSIDLGEIPLEHARALLRAVGRSLELGLAWHEDDYAHLVGLKAMLTYRIAKAEKAAAA